MALAELQAVLVAAAVVEARPAAGEVCSAATVVVEADTALI